MKFFISHSSRDNDAIQKILNVLDGEHKKWVDLDQIGDGDEVSHKINEGLKDCTHFFLLWTINASESFWVRAEIAAYLEKRERLHLIIFKLDNTDLGVPLAGLKSFSTSKKQLEKDFRDKLSELATNFEDQLQNFRSKVIEDYENPPHTPRNPIISNFRKFHGFKYYVQQRFLLEGKEQEKIGNYLIHILNVKVNQYKKIQKLKSEILHLDEAYSKITSDSIVLEAFNLHKSNFRNSPEEIIMNKLGLNEQIIERINVDPSLLKAIRSHTNQVNNSKKSYLDMNKKRNPKDGYSKVNEHASYEEEIILREKFKSFSQTDIEKIIRVKKVFSNLDHLTDIYEKLSKRRDELDIILKGNLLPVVGEYGAGKSALCHHLVYRICKEFPEEIIPIFIPLGQLPKYDLPTDKIVEDIYRYIIREYGFELTMIEFNSYIKSGKVILILDALDEMTKKLDPNLAQHNLSQIIKLSTFCLIILTSRHTYLTENMEKKLLINYSGFIKILDFSKNEITAYLRLFLEHNENRIIEIEEIMNSNRLKELAQKPLFLNIITANFDELKEYFPINESVILKVLTDAWIRHDVLNKEIDISLQKKIINERQRISEILAIAQYEKARPIGKEIIQDEVKNELRYTDSQAENRLSQYYKDAITSTFLIREENELYRFILNPVIEYFVARCIVNDIKNDKEQSFLKHVNLVRSIETFEFIKGIIDIEWAVKAHVYKDLPGKIRNNEKLRNFENLSRKLVNLIEKLRTKDGKHANVKNILRILNMTNNVPSYLNISNLDLNDINLSNSNLIYADLTDSNLSNAVLTGCNLKNINLKGANLTNAKLVGSDLTGADLTGADLTGADLTGAELKDIKLISCNFKNSNLTNSRISNCIVNEAKFIGTNFSNSFIFNIDFSKSLLANAIFDGVECISLNFPHLLNGVSFKRNNLEKMNFTQYVMTKCNFQETNLNNVNFTNTDLKGADFRWSKFTHAIVFRADIHGAKIYGADTEGTDFSTTYGDFYPEH